MTHRRIPVVAAALAAAAPLAAPAAAPAQQRLSLHASQTIVTWSTPLTLNGRLSRGSVRNVLLRLEQDVTRPYGDAYAPTARTVRTDRRGRFSFFGVRPLVNTQFRVTARAGQVRSTERLVVVRILTGLKVGTTRPSRGALVRFSGSVFPAHDGRTAYIQKRNSRGAFSTVARTTLRDTGEDRSAYSRRVRVRTSGTYRVKVAGDADHVNGFSRERTLTVR